MDGKRGGGGVGRGRGIFFTQGPHRQENPSVYLERWSAMSVGGLVCVA